MDESIPRRWSSRKFMLGLMLSAMFTGLVYSEVVSDTVYMGLMMFTWGGYLTGNIGEYLARR